MKLVQPFPVPEAPMVDIDTGMITRVWRDFLRNILARTGSEAGPSAPLTDLMADGILAGLVSDPAECADLSEVTMLALLTDVQEPGVNVAPINAAITAANAAISGLQDQVSAMAFAETEPCDTTSVILGAMLLMDTPDGRLG